jgi:hypothetical protein
MGFYEMFFRTVMSLVGLIVFSFALFMTFVACTQTVYPWRRSWPYVLFGWVMSALIFYLGMYSH